MSKVPIPPLLLASTSPYRRELLERLGVRFEVEAPGVEERHWPEEPPDARARRLALEKARAVGARKPDAWIIGSDQVGSAGAARLDKPGNAASCRTQLEYLSGREAVFHTAVALVRGAEALTHLDETRVRFRTLTGAEIARYVERERPFDCAGSLKSEGLGITLLAGIETSDATALVGLPLLWLSSALRQAGYLLP